MDSNPLLAALQSNYGDGTPPPPDPTTVRGLLAYCKLWLDGEVRAEKLNNPCMAMAGRLKGGAEATEQDLAQNPDMVDSARAPIERTAEAYWTIAEVLDRLPDLAQNNDTEAFKEAIGLFEEERQAVLDATAEIERSMSGKIRLCPRCGDQSEEHICSGCDLIKLYPDPKATEYDRSKTAVLDPIYGVVNKAYDEVMSGISSLPTVIHAVNLLDERLIEVQKGYEGVLAVKVDEDELGAEEKDSRELANRMLDELDRTFEAIDRIRSVEESFQMADLSRGWDTIFDSAVDMQRASQRFAKAHNLIEMIRTESDSVDFGGG